MNEGLNECPGMYDPLTREVFEGEMLKRNSIHCAKYN